MRIVAGRWKGRTIKPPADPRVRPTADRVREAWMSIVMPDDTKRKHEKNSDQFDLFDLCDATRCPGTSGDDSG